ncbi:restriction endonuclease subunit S [Streptomyces anulatus]
MRSVRLGDLARFIRGVTFKPIDVVPAETEGAVRCMRTKNVQSSLDTSDVWSIDSGLVKREEQYLRAGDLLISSANSWNLVGKCSWIPEMGNPATFGGFVSVLRGDEALIQKRYLYHWFVTSNTQATVRSFSRQTTNIANLDLKRCLELQVPIPSLAEQKRTAEVLDQVETLRVKRRKALNLLDDLAGAVFMESVGAALADAGENSVPLSDVAAISSGITKGRKVPTGTLRKVPYLAVANVQDRRLDLSAVKEIEVSEAEIARFSLREGDLLLTEGGDPDKLGRGTLWSEELALCLHQNHVFKVRVSRPELIDPVYLKWVVSSGYGKRYFLRVAKQTTGIASINKTQLSAFPLPVVEFSAQREFRRRVEAIEAQKSVHLAHLAALDELFTSLQKRAFTGRLWDHEAA